MALPTPVQGQRATCEAPNPQTALHNPVDASKKPHGQETNNKPVTEVRTRKPTLLPLKDWDMNLPPHLRGWFEKEAKPASPPVKPQSPPVSSPASPPVSPPDLQQTLIVDFDVVLGPYETLTPAQYAERRSMRLPPNMSPQEACRRIIEFRGLD
ncbi:uncharacterized protein KY384_002325 [Bacidia gigantensis]|uniref:uncharacterized protein n=1 Tax=Bacidia gigantensis TaxID=2732470 RepID=UPI001D053F92|nr:uncharacterized protein KY384_002325 [Bacidia gigantensis]KAG8532448.1 hypothetical protein KY384_002325 [Bacidia gigantensis]